MMPAYVHDPGPAVDSFLSRDGKVVTFDLFDTLLWRRVLFPADLFRMLPYGWSRSLRRGIEAVATVACRRLLSREPQLADIYRLYPFDPSEEFRLEVRLAQANPWCLALVKKLQARGVKVAVVSDMYLSSSQIDTLLSVTGYPTVPIYVSSEAKCSKHTDGQLFSYVRARLGVSTAAWIHVGDNPHADISMAMRHGLTTCLVQTPRNTLLTLQPGLSSARWRQYTASDPVFLGELAIALHVGLFQEPAAAVGLPTRLASLLVEAGRAGWSAQTVAERALSLPD